MGYTVQSVEVTHGTPVVHLTVFQNTLNQLCGVNVVIKLPLVNIPKEIWREFAYCCPCTDGHLYLYRNRKSLSGHPTCEGVLRSVDAQRRHPLILPRWRQNFSGVLLIVGLEQGLLWYAHEHR